jgi:type IV secretion system protein VirB5
MMKCSKFLAGAVASAFVVAMPAQATVPVIDVAALQQLIQSAIAWQRQLQGMQSQLAQLEQTRTALTGPRGMERLLQQSVADRNYLPADWVALDSLVHGGTGRFPELAARVRSLAKANARLSDADLAKLSTAARAMVLDSRQTASTDEALTQVAYERSSARFATLGQLIDRIGTTGDAKAIADLQGRIAAEQAMLENEAVKLQSLAYSAEANRASAEVSRREAVIRGHGTFATRFQPTLPAP